MLSSASRGDSAAPRAEHAEATGALCILFQPSHSRHNGGRVVQRHVVELLRPGVFVPVQSVRTGYHSAEKYLNGGLKYTSNYGINYPVIITTYKPECPIKPRFLDLHRSLCRRLGAAGSTRLRPLAKFGKFSCLKKLCQTKFKICMLYKMIIVK